MIAMVAMVAKVAIVAMVEMVHATVDRGVYIAATLSEAPFFSPTYVFLFTCGALCSSLKKKTLRKNGKCKIQ